MTMTEPTNYVWMYKFKIYDRTHEADTRIYATQQLALDKIGLEVVSYEFDKVSVDNEDGSVVYWCRDGVKFEVWRMRVRTTITTEE